MSEARESTTSVIPPRDPNDAFQQATIRSTVGRVAEMDLILEMLAADGEEYSRNELANFLWEAGMVKFWEERKLERPKDPAAALREWRKKHFRRPPLNKRSG